MKIEVYNCCNMKNLAPLRSAIGIMGSGKMGHWLIGKICVDREANK